MDDPIVVVRRRAPGPGAVDADRGLLAEVAARALGVAPGDVAVTRRCPHCGGSDHGRPGAAGVYLSLSRAGGLVAVAASRHRPVGVDVEELDRVAAAGFDDVAFAAEERAAIARAASPDAYRAMLWTSKEALLKASGRGLRTDPALLRIGDARRLDSWPASEHLLEGATLLGIETPPGFVGTLALLRRGSPDAATRPLRE